MGIWNLETGIGDLGSARRGLGRPAPRYRLIGGKRRRGVCVYLWIGLLFFHCLLQQKCCFQATGEPGWVWKYMSISKGCSLSAGLGAPPMAREDILETLTWPMWQEYEWNPLLCYPLVLEVASYAASLPSICLAISLCTPHLSRHLATSPSPGTAPSGLASYPGSSPTSAQPPCSARDAASSGSPPPSPPPTPEPWPP